MAKGKLPPEVTAIIPPIYACLEDRNGEVQYHMQVCVRCFNIFSTIMGSNFVCSNVEFVGNNGGSSIMKREKKFGDSSTNFV